MAIRRVLIFVTFAAAAVCAGAGETEDGEPKKRGAGKTSLNAIPTGAQKPEYTYSIYPQSASPQIQPSPYQTQQAPNSFYPNQQPSQYYTSASSPTDASSYPQQPQKNLVPPPSPSQFLPINFIPNPGYQPKFQILPTKGQNGHLQLAIIQQPQLQSPFAAYPHQLFSPNPNQQVNPQLPPQGYNVAPNFQPFQLGSSYLGQQSTMFLVAPPNPSSYNNLLYSNPVQSLYNYYPSNSQAKYSYASSQPSAEYDKLQGQGHGQGQGSLVSKEDNDISAHNTEYTITPSDSSNYKSAYAGAGAASRRSSYTKL